MSQPILLLNCGSSSIKYQLLDPAVGVPQAVGIVQRIGQEVSTITHEVGEAELFQRLGHVLLDLGLVGAGGVPVVQDPADPFEPATAVVSLVNPDQITSIRSSFCNQVHYFTSDEDAAGWLAEHPRAEVVPVAVAYRIGTDLTTGFLNQFQANAAVADDGHCRC